MKARDKFFALIDNGADVVKRACLRGIGNSALMNGLTLTTMHVNVEQAKTIRNEDDTNPGIDQRNAQDESSRGQNHRDAMTEEQGYEARETWLQRAAKSKAVYETAVETALSGGWSRIIMTPDVCFPYAVNFLAQPQERNALLVAQATGGNVEELKARAARIADIKKGRMLELKSTVLAEFNSLDAVGYEDLQSAFEALPLDRQHAAIVKCVNELHGAVKGVESYVIQSGKTEALGDIPLLRQAALEVFNLADEFVEEHDAVFDLITQQGRRIATPRDDVVKALKAVPTAPMSNIANMQDDAESVLQGGGTVIKH